MGDLERHGLARASFTRLHRCFTAAGCNPCTTCNSPIGLTFGLVCPVSPAQPLKPVDPSDLTPVTIWTTLA